MKKSIYLVSAFFSINLFALDINEAIEYSLGNNYSVKENKEIINENKELYNSSKSLYHPKFDLKYTVDNKFQKNVGENKNDSELNVDLTYNLFNGFRDEKSIENSENNIDISRYDYKAKKYDIILQTKQEYIEYLKAKKNSIVKASAVKLFQKQYDDTKNFYDNGVNITLNNLLEVEISLLKAGKSLKEAKSAERIAKQRLFNTMGIKVDERIFEIPLKKEEYTKYLNQNVTFNTVEILALKSNKEILINEKDIVKGNYYPKLDATLQHKRYGYSLSLNDRDGNSKPQNIALFQISWNLYNGKKDQSNIIAHKHKINQVNFQIEQLKQDLELNYSDAREQLILAIQNLTISKKTFEQAKVNYDIVNNSFKEGIVTSKDLIDANYLLSSSEASYYDSYYTNLLAIATLERLLETDKN